MSTTNLAARTVGWIGTGKMGFPMAARLIAAGADVKVYNRTASKAAPLGVPVVDSPAALAGRDIVFTMLADDAALHSAVLGPDGLLSASGGGPKILVDCSTVSLEVTTEIRSAAEARGTAFVIAPVSGNGHAAEAGKISVGASGPADAYEQVLPYLERFGRGVSYLGSGDEARLVKVAHNVMIAVVAQCMAEMTVLCETGGVERHAFLDFLNKSVLGSVFTRYKTPAYVNLDFTATHTTRMLRKDIDLALATAREREVPMPVAGLTRECLQALIGHGHGEDDFAALVEMEARAAGYAIAPENVAVSDGLREAAE